MLTLQKKEVCTCLEARAGGFQGQAPPLQFSNFVRPCIIKGGGSVNADHCKGLEYHKTKKRNQINLNYSMVKVE